MKTITLFVAAFLCSSLMIAQDNFFVHTATAGTISADLTVIDHPDLNGNPNAEILITHVWNPGGSGGIYNTNNTGVYYDGSQWGIYNESGAAMIENSSYNVYIGNGTDVFMHQATAPTISSDYSYIDHPDLNGNPNALVTLSTYYNPSTIRNDHPYGVWFDAAAGTSGQWAIYTEDLAGVVLNSAFFVGIIGTSTASHKHTASAGTISSNYTIISHPLLDGNPNAKFVMSHNWGASGDSANVIVNHVLGVWYNGSNWSIYTEDLAAFPPNAEFDLKIEDPALAVNDQVLDGLRLYPNPAGELLNINSPTAIEQVSIFNLLGQEVLNVNGVTNTIQIDVSMLNSGQYFAKVNSGNTVQTLRFIKR